ncbi:MAG: PKD domain-containing protein [Polaribacter sp.]
MTIITLIAIALAIWLPSKKKFVNLDILISDQNNNFQLEKGERLEFRINDTLAFKKAKMLWEFGNGDSIVKNNIVNYRYNAKGKYLVTLTINDKFEVSNYIEIIEPNRNTARDSVPTIHGVDKGYVNEQLVFLTNTPGIKSWYWEFGETGTVDAYESQVIYTYKKPGIYMVKLKTDQSRFPVYHRIEILPLFNPITTEPIDSLKIVANDIKKRLQAIADASVKSTKIYYKNLKHIEQNYKCKDDEMVMIVNGSKYNDLYSYCQGLHYLDGRGSKTIVINEVVVDTVRCIKEVTITQNIIKK